MTSQQDRRRIKIEGAQRPIYTVYNVYACASKELSPHTFFND